MGDAKDATGSTNVVVLRGEVRGEPVERSLASGVAVVQFDVAARLAGAAAIAPVSISDPPTSVRDLLHDGANVVVLGGVRRRFFRVDGRTQSRTEVIATRVVPARRRAAVGRLLAEATSALDA